MAEKRLRINNQIRAIRVILIDEDGKRMGEFLSKDALEVAKERGLDLVEVSPSQTPICRLMDFGKHQYQQKKEKKKSAITKTKEIKIRPKTDKHDMDVRIKQARKFISQGNRVKVVVRFRGREHAHRDIGRDRCLEIAQQLEDIAVIESQPSFSGREMTMILVGSTQ